MWLIVALFVLAIVSRPIEVRLWRRGRISDRTTALLLLGRLPAFVLLSGLILGWDPLVTLSSTILLVVVELLGYPLIRTLLKDVRREQEKPGQRIEKSGP